MMSGDVSVQCYISICFKFFIEFIEILSAGYSYKRWCQSGMLTEFEACGKVYSLLCDILNCLNLDFLVCSAYIRKYQYSIISYPLRETLTLLFTFKGNFVHTSMEILTYHPL